MKRLIVLTDWGCWAVFEQLYDQIHHELPEDLNADDTLLLEGGADIHPRIYGEEVGKYTYPSAVLRDAREIDAFRKIQAVGGSVIGICRGAQLASVMLGAPLIQHVDGHEASGGHFIKLKNGDLMFTTSVHHQMMNPFSLDKSLYDLIAWSRAPLSHRYLNGKDEDIRSKLPEDFVEPEIVWFPTIRCLAIQGHPEYMTGNEKFRIYCVQLAKELIHHV